MTHELRVRKEPTDASKNLVREDLGSNEALIGALRLMLAKVEDLQRGSSSAIADAASRVSRCELAQLFIGARERRGRHLPVTLFGEPGWDMLLDLYVSYCNDRSVSVTSACLASGVPATTALRYLSNMHREGLIERRPDPNDRRRDFIAISDDGISRVEAYLDGFSRWAINLHQIKKGDAKSP